MPYINSKFSKIAKRWGLCAPLTSNYGDLKLRDFAKIVIFKRTLTKLNFQKISFHAILVKSSLL